MIIAVYTHTPVVARNPRPPKQLIGSVQRALRILEQLAAHPQGLTAKQVALKMQLNLSTCYHLLNTLEHEGYLVKEPETSCFRVSGKIGFTVFNQASPAQLVQHLTPHVQTLQEISGETAYLSVWDGREITLSAIVEAPQTVRVKSLTIGETGANHASALGKAILAALPDAALARYFTDRPLPAFTPNTVTTLEQLRTLLADAWRQGYALDCEEFMPQVHCIGAPVFDAQQHIAASLAISLPVSRAEGNRPALIANVKQMAQAATRALQVVGYAGPASHLEVTA